jgi:hypothetical protein
MRSFSRKKRLSDALVRDVTTRFARRERGEGAPPSSLERT